MKWVYNDGGRGEAGFKGEVGDCVTRAISIATEIPYHQVYFDLKKQARNFNKWKMARGQRKCDPRKGVYKSTFTAYLKSLGWKFIPTMGIGTGCKVHLRKEELPSGNLIVSLSKHMASVINGELHDTFDCSRNGKRCVYGYFIKEKMNYKEQK